MVPYCTVLFGLNELIHGRQRSGQTPAVVRIMLGGEKKALKDFSVRVPRKPPEPPLEVGILHTPLPSSLKYGFCPLALLSVSPIS